MIAPNIAPSQISMEECPDIIKNKFLQLPHQIVTLRRGQIIYHQGDRIDKIGFILKGVMKCTKYTADGDEINPHYFYAVEIFPEYLLLTGESHYIYTLIAEKPSQVILVDFRRLRDLIMSDLRWCQLLISYMAHRGLLAEKWRMCNCYGNIRSKIAYMLLEIYQASDQYWIEIKDCQRIISSKLQISRTAYNQELMRLEEEKIIKRVRSKIKLVNRETLASYI